MATYYPSSTQQTPPYPTHEPSYYLAQQQYPHRQNQFLQQWQNQPSYAPPQQQQQSYSGAQQSWDPTKIWQEANGTSNTQPQQRSNNNFFSQAQPSQFQAQSQTQDGERGLGAAVLGGGAGAFLGHEMGHGKMATLGGLAVGAIAAEVFEHHHEKKKREHRVERAYDEGFVRGEGRERELDYGGGRSRGLDDDGEEEYYEDEREEYEPRHHHHHHHHGDDGYGEEYVERDGYEYRDERRY